MRGVTIAMASDSSGASWFPKAVADAIACFGDRFSAK